MKKNSPKKSKNAAKSVSRVKKPVHENVALATAASKTADASDVVLVDQRSSDRRTKSDRRKESVPVAMERRKLERRVKVNRRRQIDPTTCERDYTSDEIEFMNAMDEYKRISGRMFPTCSEILEVVVNLGYSKRPVLAVESAYEPVMSIDPAATANPPATLA